MTSFTVNTKDFRNALRSAALFAGKDPEVDMWHRVRLDVGPVNVQVWATNGYAAGLSIASVVDNGDGELDTLDLAPAQVKDVLHLFPVERGHADEQLLEVAVPDGEHVSVRDVSGLFPGKFVELPRLPRLEGAGDHDPLNAVPALIGRTVHDQAKHYLDGVIVTNAEWVALFSTAARIYGEALCLTPYSEATGRGRLLATAGESFVGVLMGRSSLEDDHVREAVEGRDAWRRRLPAVTTHDPVVDLRTAVGLLEGTASSDDGEEADDDQQQ